jgi:hypothetical protein
MAIAAVEALTLPADQDRVQLLLALGDALSRAGDFAESRRIFLRSADLARRMGSESLLAASAFGYGGRQPWVRAGRDTRLVPLLHDALVTLTQQLAAAVGLGGRDRDPGSAAERARVSVTRAIRSAMDRLALQSPSMGAHLDATIRTGIYCSYTPDPRAPIAWNAPARETEGVPADPATVL